MLAQLVLGVPLDELAIRLNELSLTENRVTRRRESAFHPVGVGAQSLAEACDGLRIRTSLAVKRGDDPVNEWLTTGTCDIQDVSPQDADLLFYLVTDSLGSQ